VNLVDSSGWLEYFADGKNASFFAPAIENTKLLLVSSINCSEVFKRIAQQRDENAAMQAIAVMQEGAVVDVTSDLAIVAAKIALDLKLPLADSVILATARMNQATVWTQDSDFDGIAGVRYISKRLAISSGTFFLRRLASAFSLTSFVSAAKPTQNGGSRRAATVARMSTVGWSVSVSARSLFLSLLACDCAGA
jgi:predicted nucleic acid-binding protein